MSENERRAKTAHVAQITGLHQTLEKSFEHFKEVQGEGADFDLYKLELAADLYWQLRSALDGLSKENDKNQETGGFDLDFV